MEQQPWVDYKLKRGVSRALLRDKGIGLCLTIKARPAVEEYIKQLAGNRSVEATAFSDLWFNCGPDDAPLRVYDIGETESSGNYSITDVGLPLIRYIANGGGANAPRRGTAPQPAFSLDSLTTAGVVEKRSIINLSPLRLVGIGSPEGVTIGLAGMYSWDYVNVLRNSLPQATKQFLSDYIVPVTINLQIVGTTHLER